MGNLAKANVQRVICTSVIMEIMKLTIKEDFHHGTCYLFRFLITKITLFEKKYDIKLMILISMYHLKPLVSLDRFIKN